MTQPPLFRAIRAVVLTTALLVALWFAWRSPEPRAQPDAACTDSASATPIAAPPGSTRPLPPVTSPRESAPIDRGELVRQCLRTAETDVLTAIDLALTQKLTNDDRGLLTALVMRWAEQDFSGALEWARSSAPGNGRDNILAHLAFLQAQSDPLAAARIVTYIAEGPVRDEAVISVVHQWSRRDRETARYWIDGISQEALRRRAPSRHRSRS